MHALPLDIAGRIHVPLFSLFIYSDWSQLLIFKFFNNFSLYSGLKQDQLVKLLANEPDFLKSRPLLVEELEKIGAHVLFGVKFHPELMPIESCYR